MGFLDTVIVPKSTNPTPVPAGTSSFVSSVSLPANPAEAVKIAQLQSAQQVATLNAQNENSVSGIVANTIKDLGTRVLNVPIDFAKNLWSTYQITPSKLAEDVQAGASDMQTGGSTNEQATGFFKGIIKAGTRTAGDAAIAIFAPISAAIGSVLTATGGQPLVDKAGQVIADASGITDLPAFQKFAMEHPNAGEDFNRLLTLFMAQGEKGQIDPVRITKEATTLAQKLVKKTPKTAPETTPAPVTGETVPVATPEAPKATEASVVADTTPLTEKFPALQPDAIPQRVTSTVYDESILPAELKPAKSNVVEGETGNNAILADVPVEKFGTPKFETLNQDSYTPGVPITDPIFAKYDIVSGQYVITDGANRFTQAVANGDKNIPTVVEIVKNGEPVPASPVGTGKAVPNTRAVKLDQAAVERKLTSGLTDLPTHNQINMQEQAQLALKYADQHPEHALQVAIGESMPPSHILPEAMYTALEARAIREGDTATIQALSKSKIPTAAGQALKALDSADPDSPVSIIRNLNKVLEDNFKKKTGKDPAKAKKQVVEEIKKEIKSTAAKRPTWEEFIKEVQCTY